MISKDARISIDLKFEPVSNIFPLRVILGDTRYDFEARLIDRIRVDDADRFEMEIVGDVRMTAIQRSKKKRARR